MTAGIDRLNRVLLFLIGLVCLAGGVVVLLISFRALGHDLANQPLLRADTRAFADRNAGWFWAAVGIGAGLLALLALRWLIAQAHTQRVASLSLEPRRELGHTKLSSGALTDAVGEETERLRGVSSANAHLLGKRGDPTLRLDVRLGEDADLDYLRTRLERNVIPNARQAVSLPQLPTRVRLTMPSQHRRQIR